MEIDERYKMHSVESNKRFQDSFRSENIICGEENGGCFVGYLALATHSMMASFLPTVTLVFFGGMIMEGAIGSAGPPTSVTRQKPTTNLELKPFVQLMMIE